MKCLLENGSLPTKALLVLSFIGTNMVEILCHKPLLNRLIATMKRIGFRYLESFDPMKTSSKNLSHEQAITACYRRWTQCGANTNNVHVKKFYQQSAKNIRSKHPFVKEMQPATKTPTPAQKYDQPQSTPTKVNTTNTTPTGITQSTVASKSRSVIQGPKKDKDEVLDSDSEAPRSVYSSEYGSDDMMDVPLVRPTQENDGLQIPTNSESPVELSL